ncbi:hypothetical protein MMC17_006247 [Xylographa soralifera]|nr:hypothetical protein [Xylographa soralifera]
MPHKAIWLEGEKMACEQRTINETYSAGEGQSIVSVQYSGINPADIKHYFAGIKDTVPGYDFSGKVISTAPGSAFKAGDSVAGTTPTGISRKSAWGAHQDVLVATDSMMFKVPDHMPMQEAAGLAITTRTAIIGLYCTLHLPLPSAPENCGAILIWGGASSVGSACIQLAKASGCHPIYTTASAHNHAMLKEIGATECFDYKSPTVLDDIRAAVKASGVPLNMAFDTVGLMGNRYMVDNCFDVCSDASTAEVVTCCRGTDRSPFVNAMPDWDVDMDVPGVGLQWYMRAAASSEKMFDVLEWVVENYGKGFVMPHVQLVPWDAAIPELMKSMAGQNSGVKTVIEHS